MAFVDKDGYVARVPHGGGRTSNGIPVVRNWYMLKHCGNSIGINIKTILFPKGMVGRKIRLKVEFID